jgi:hypothetical protein
VPQLRRIRWAHLNRHDVAARLGLSPRRLREVLATG